jgi:hypothetical protein
MLKFVHGNHKNHGKKLRVVYTDKNRIVFSVFFVLSVDKKQSKNSKLSAMFLKKQSAVIADII